MVLPRGGGSNCWHSCEGVLTRARKEKEWIYQNIPRTASARGAKWNGKTLKSGREKKRSCRFASMPLLCLFRWRFTHANTNVARRKGHGQPPIYIGRNASRDGIATSAGNSNTTAKQGLRWKMKSAGRASKVLAPMPARKRHENTQDITAGSGCSSHDLFGWRESPMGTLQPQPPMLADMLQMRKNHRPHQKCRSIEP